ncbi:MAG TPA: acetate uptake transporter [Geopsychrobacteraceae bacterium]|nr:acetate uptake transporter [Geopsychrobacteraceae bacterium]
MKQILPANRSLSCALPPLGLLAFAFSIMLYPLVRAGMLPISPSLLGLILILAGATQVSAGLKARQQGNHGGSGTFIPLGLFWLSLLGVYIFPALGLGVQPSAVAMTSYLTMWGIFAAILYLGSFRQSKVIQLLFGAMMICLLSLGLAELRGNTAFLYAAAVAGPVSGLAALYSGLAQVLNARMQRTIMPLGSWQTNLDRDYDKQVSS